MHVLSYLVDLDLYPDRARMLAAAARHADVRMTLLCWYPPREAALSSLDGVRVETLTDRRYKRQINQALLLKWWLTHRPKVDLIHDTQGFMTPLFAMLQPSRDRPIRLTSTFASIWEWYTLLRGRWPVEWVTREARYWHSMAEEWALARVSDAFTVFGEGHREPFAALNRVPLDRVFALRNCVDPERFQPASARDTGFPPGTRVLGFVGAAFRYKGIHETLECVARLSRTHPDVRLLILGAQPQRAARALEQAVRAHGLEDRVRAPGKVPREHLPQYLSAMEVVLAPSYAEGSPRAVIEAMACGRPIVATRIAGVEYLDPRGDALRLVPRFDADALTTEVAALLDDPTEAAALGARARQRYLASLTPETAGAQMAGIYRALLEGRTSEA